MGFKKDEAYFWQDSICLVILKKEPQSFGCALQLCASY
jgi:hypothetical protein